MRYSTDKTMACQNLNTGFTHIVLNLKKYRFDKPFKNWVRRTMINHIIDQVRKNKTYNRHLEEAQLLNSSHHGFEINSGTSKMEFDDLLKILDVLPSSTKDVFNLFAIDGYSHKEISKMLGISEGTSKWHVSTARKSLQNFLSKKERAAAVIELNPFFTKSSES